ncbi:hypothetical protein [Bacillus cereus]|uniref:hypothetical protein n=1 Tax=Bacillus cereus TaxID=1396 RepID=UPI000BF4A09C|nr:hypothetical protein [Bacillus cereus]PET19473.1 hypothetical protein CN519_29375 [Bacillus cereus]PEU34330.1 hypothetical protein CN387_29240 [Bacillus cereus]PEY73872.1 hypothetical protein CN344_27190 [Bacillus cereus]PFI11187.1 hypothetical protein COI71_29460 [Bacillus cereus]PFS86304.1 hypothetical protein COK54_27455 [Bacillus cereus]
MDIIKVIEMKLEQLKLPQYNILKPNIQEYLLKIETIVQQKEMSRKIAVQEYRNGKISVNNIVKDIGISRQTVYNNREILEAYILYCISMQDKEDVFLKGMDNKNKIRELEETIFYLQQRDVTIENSKIYLKDYEERIEVLLDGLSKQKQQNSALIQRIKELEKINIVNNTNVIGLYDEIK